MKLGRIAIFGAGGHGEVVADMLDCEEVGFFDDNPKESCRGSWDSLIENYKCWDGLVIAIGKNIHREKCYFRWLVELKSLPVLRVIHAKAIISRNATIGCGSVAMAGAILNTGCDVGKYCILNTASSVDHHCQLGDGSHICPGAHLGGNVEVGKRAWIGIGATVKNGMKIGDDAFVGAGAVVVNDVPAGVTAVGNPARPLERKDTLC